MVNCYSQSGAFRVCFLFCYAILCVLSSFAIIDEEEKSGCFTFIRFLMSCDCYSYVALPHGVMGGSAVGDCGGIS